VHDEKIVQVEKIEGREAKETSDGGFPVSMPLD